MTKFEAQAHATDPEFLIALATLAIDAGDVIMNYFGRDIVAETKSDASPVTIADREAEAIITSGLQRIAPGVQVIGEEMCAEQMPSRLDDCFFLVDPLDGTREFIEGRTDFTVNIGLIYQRKPYAGVIFAPAHQALYISGATSAHYVEPQSGTTLMWEDFTPISCRETMATGLTVVASRSHKSPETEAYLANLEVADHISAGSSLKFCLLAAGKADLYPRLGRTMEWDTAAGHAILQSAGGMVTDLEGQPLIYGKLDRGLDNPHFIAMARQIAEITE
jgi:3'(2'), 5'-bisphosphate nucleotidase